MDKGTMIRTLILIMALVNQFLVSAGLNPIPGSEALWGEILTACFTAFAGFLVWFKNNYITLFGRKQKKVLEDAGLIKRK